MTSFSRLVPRRIRAVATLAALCGLATTAHPSAAQTLEQVVVQRRLELRAARATHESARNTFEVVERQFSSALDEVRDARNSGDGDRLERAYAQALDRSVPLRDQERRLEEAQAALDAARGRLIEVLEARLEQLVREMDAAPGGRERARLDVLFRDLSAELQSLEAETGGTFRIDPVVLPEITFDPRDGPDELRFKAEVLERKAADADSVIRNTEGLIQTLSNRLRTQRQVRDMVASLDRFDDTRVPVVTGAPPGDRASVTDSTVVGARPLTLEERIEVLRDYITQLEAYRDQLLIRAEQFRRSVGAVA